MGNARITDDPRIDPRIKAMLGGIDSAAGPVTPKADSS